MGSDGCLLHELVPLGAEVISPRLIRYRDAPAYLGMDRNRVDSDVRPTLTEIPIGQRANSVGHTRDRTTLLRVNG